MHVSCFQRPSDIGHHVDMHVLNTSNGYDYDTSLHDTMVSQCNHGNQSYDSSLILETSSNEDLPSTQQSQQVSDDQVVAPDVSLSSATTSISAESSQHNSISLHNIPDQSSSSNALNLGLRDKGFRIGHLNIQGLTNKIDQLKLLLQPEQNLVHILDISETKLNPVHPDAPFNIDGYQKPFRRDRTENAGGGLLVYVKEGVFCDRRLDLEHQMLEYMVRNKTNK